MWLAIVTSPTNEDTDMNFRDTALKMVMSYFSGRLPYYSTTWIGIDTDGCVCSFYEKPYISEHGLGWVGSGVNVVGYIKNYDGVSRMFKAEDDTE